MKKKLLYLVMISISLPLVVFIAQRAQSLLGLAAPQPANIVIDVNNIVGRLTNNWSSFSQGGEEPPPMLTRTIDKLREVSPRYIRLDHIYDYYGVVKRSNNSFEYDFSQLDKTVDDILATGALPFLSLSYMPPVFTATSTVIDVPTDWNLWRDLVRATIEHYSGKNKKNLTYVYYEVWNEPELPQFGGWKLSSEKDYRLLYFYAAKGAEMSQNVNTFYFGGPSVGSYYSSWVSDFLSYVVQNNLRLDFYSWHRYTKKPADYVTDSNNIKKKLSAFSQYANLPIILTEWGIESENTVINNSDAAASFTAAAISKFHDSLNLAFAFEIKDGPPPNGGKWGILTHEKDPSPLSPKPRFHAFATLSKMEPDIIHLTGTGTFVTGFASKGKDGVTVILTNYDLTERNTENFPVTFSGLSPSSYILTYDYPLENLSGSHEIVSTNGSLSKSFLMKPNSILFLELKPEASIATFIPGKNGQANDKAFVLKNNTPFSLTTPEFQLRSKGSIELDLKLLWDRDDRGSFLIFEAPYSTSSSQLNRLFLAKQRKPEGNMLSFGISSNREEVVTFTQIADWQRDEWHHLSLGWDTTGIWMSVDNQEVIKNTTPVDIRNGKILSFYPADAAIDNLKIVLGENQVIERSFDGRID